MTKVGEHITLDIIGTTTGTERTYIQSQKIF